MPWNSIKIIGKSLFALLLFLLCASVAHATNLVSPFNNLALDLDEKDEKYSFLIGGHLYGAHGDSTFPASSLLANVEMINSRDAKFFVSLGDYLRNTDFVHFPSYQKAFVLELSMPFFNAVGNHDVTDRELYEATFGKTYYSFAYNSCLFIFLDSELDNGSIVDDQLIFFRTIIQNTTKESEIDHVFIFSHRLIWDVDRLDYQIVFEHANDTYEANNFTEEIEPILVELSKYKDVYWVSGDIGTLRSLPLFYNKDSNHNIAYVAVGLGDTRRDALLQVNVSKSNGVAFTPVSLTGQDLSPMESYDLNYWQDYFGQVAVNETQSNETIFDLYWGKVYRMVNHNYFYGGIFSGMSAAWILTILLRKYRRR